MAKQPNQKLKILYLLKILYEQTDAESGLTLSQISTELSKYGISAARKSLYDDIEALRVFGVDICIKRDRYVRYYIAERAVTFAELKYICDALSSFEAIPPSAACELSKKLVKIFGVKRSENGICVFEPTYKTPELVYNEQAKNIELLSLAISNGRKISCKEFSWNSLKQRIILNDSKKLTLTPIRIICDKAYMLCAYNGKSFSLHNVDRLLELEILNDKAENLSAYREIPEANLGVEYENLRLECDLSFAGEIFEKFGLGVTVLSNREESFEISVKARLDDSFYAWLFNNSRYVRVVSPNRVRDDLKQKLLMALDNIDRDFRVNK